MIKEKRAFSLILALSIIFIIFIIIVISAIFFISDDIMREEAQDRDEDGSEGQEEAVEDKLEEKTLGVEIEGEGSSNPSEGTHEYDHGRNISVNANSGEGWEFAGFEGDCTGTTCKLTMTDDKEVKLIFEEAGKNRTLKTCEDIEIPSSAESYREGILDQYGDMEIGELFEEAIGITVGRDAQRALLIRKEESLPLLKEKLVNGTEEEQVGSLRLVIEILRWEEFLPEILIVLGDSDNSEEIRGEAAIAASLFQAKEAIPEIRELLKTAEDKKVRKYAMMSLGVFQDKESIDLIKERLESNSSFEQVRAAGVLGQLGDDSGLETALELSHDDHFGLRINAAEALSVIGTPEAIERVQEMAEEDESSSVRRDSSWYLTRAELEKLDDEEIIERLEENLTTGGLGEEFVYFVRYFACDAPHVLQELAESGYSRRVSTALLKLESGVVMLPRP